VRPVRLGRRRVAGHPPHPLAARNATHVPGNGNQWQPSAREGSVLRSDYGHMLVVRRTIRESSSAEQFLHGVVRNGRPSAWLASHIERSCSAIAVEHLTCSDARL
jgi:hypothetical protein